MKRSWENQEGEEKAISQMNAEMFLQDKKKWLAELCRGKFVAIALDYK